MKTKPRKKRKKAAATRPRWPIVSDNYAIQRDYEFLRAMGRSHSIAEMCAFRQAPGTKNTDRAFLEGTHNHNDLADMPDFMAKRIINEAKKAGISTTGKVFKGRLGSHTDPKAWVSSLSDVKRVCEERNWECEEVGTKEREEPPKPRTVLAEDIIRKEMKQRIKQDPSLAKRPGELREKVIRDHAYRPDEK